MKSREKLFVVMLGMMMLTVGSLTTVGAQTASAPDFTKFGYTVAKTMDVTPDQTVTITDGDQSVLIKPGTFDNPVTFELLTGQPSAWKDLVKDRTVRAAFAFRITDKTTKALLAGSKIPVVYSYSGKDAKADDTIFNTTPANPPVASQNPIPTTFADGKVTHPFNIAVVGWIVVSAPTSAAAGSPAAAAPSAAAPVATGTGGGTTTSAPTTLPQTGVQRSTRPALLPLVALGGGALLLIGGLVVMRRRTASSRA